MTGSSRCSNLALVMLIGLTAAPLACLAQAPDAHASDVQGSGAKPSAEAKTELDRSGKRRLGKASFYAREFAGRKMADGNRMDPQDGNAASTTLPLGTTARVTNLKTGKSAVVTIQDRGPYVSGRIVDLSPSIAQEIGVTSHEGVAKVEVAPIAVPLADGSVKPGAAAGKIKLASRGPYGSFNPAGWVDPSVW